MKRREDLTTPRRRSPRGPRYDPEAFGQFSESIARTLGTARFLVFQTAIVILWIIVNAISWLFKFDKYPFILLTLALSLQAAYAAPLILLAQNRQENRDRLQSGVDRNVAERTQMDTEFLARELASVRISLNDVATLSELEERLDRLTTVIERVATRLDDLEVREQKSDD